MKKLIQKSENIGIALSAFKKARKDHYDGVNALYCVAAEVPILEGTSPSGLKRQADKLIKQLSLLEVRPDRICILRDSNIITVEFCAKDYQMVMTVGQYVGLLLEFSNFLSNSNISNIKIHDWAYDYDPDPTVRSANSDMINFFPEFNSLSFGIDTNTPIEVTNG